MSKALPGVREIVGSILVVRAAAAALFEVYRLAEKLNLSIRRAKKWSRIEITTTGGAVRIREKPSHLFRDALATCKACSRDGGRLGHGGRLAAAKRGHKRGGGK